MTAKQQRTREQLELAWIGDAVLTLFARQRILAQGAGIDNPLAIRMTSNRFLQSLGDATSLEARIGLIYQQHGLDAAFAWIQSEIMPLHEKQERRIAPPLRAKR
jgi:23S rRNA maturation mini-RNase III